MCAEYVAGRKECVRLAMGHAAAFGFKDEVLHDAVLLVDRTMSSGTPLPPAMLPLLVAACILISARQGDSCAFHHSISHLHHGTADHMRSGAAAVVRIWPQVSS